MLETIVTFILVIALIVAFIGVVSVSMLLLLMYGPGAAAGFAAGVTASRMGADPLTSIVIAALTFAAVTGLVFRLLSWIYAGFLLLFGASDEQLA